MNRLFFLADSSCELQDGCVRQDSSDMQIWPDSVRHSGGRFGCVSDNLGWFAYVSDN